jgi:hypothetical protein
MTNPPSAFGLYPSSKALHLAADALRSAQFRQTDISIMYSDGLRAYRLREAVAESDVSDDQRNSLGGILSTLSGVAAFDIPDEGPFLVGGPMLALVGGGHALTPSLRGLGIPEASVQRFEGRLKNGDLLLSVQCEDGDWTDRALRILRATGAEDVEVSATCRQWPTSMLLSAEVSCDRAASPAHPGIPTP